ncbi:MAG: EAL domain-containing protein [Symploca sp. SIO2C1]|nr:EAL domain-containing protein [Symploca sp. SIO2C1]
MNILPKIKLEVAVRENKNQFQTLANLSPIGLFCTDAEGQFLEVNQHWCDMARLTSSEALGEGWLQTIHPDDQERVFREWYDHNTEKSLPLPQRSYGNKSIEYRVLCPDGTTTWVLAKAVAEKDRTGAITGYIGSLTDISGRKQLEEKLQHQVSHDSLTGWPNRTMFLQHFKELQSQSLPIQLENELRQAVENCQDFVVHYQPIFDLRTDKIQGLEALVRWQHPTRGLMFPTEFIPLAQATGLIMPLERYILSVAALQLRLWHLAFPASAPLTMSVHLSVQQFWSPGLIEHIEKVLQETGLQGTSLNLEITGNTLMDTPEEMVEILLELSNRGISISIDNFDKNYSCFSRLAYLPLKTFKINRSLSEQMGEDTQEDSIVSTMINLAHNLGLEVLAEGVETEIQLEQLKRLQCDKAQGYLFCGSLEVEAVTALLASSLVHTEQQSKVAPSLASASDSLDKELLKLAQRERRLKRRLASQIRNSLDFNTILKTAINEIRHLLHVDCCQFFWWRDDVESARFEPTHQICQLGSEFMCSTCLQHQIPAIQVLGKILLEKQLLRIDDIATDSIINPEIRDFLQLRGLKSLLAITIHPNSGKVGVIVCEDNYAKRHWQDEEVELLSDMAEQLAIAIDHAKLYEETSIAAAVANAQAQQTQKALQELKETQAQLIQTEKMSSLGLLVAGVAHEINNPISFISGNINYAQQYTESLLKLLNLYQKHYPQPVAEIAELSQAIELDFVQEDLPKLMASMVMGSKRIKVIVQSLRNFSRLDEAQMKSVDIHEGIDSTLLILQNQLKAKAEHPGIEIIKEYGDLPLVECYPGQLNQVFLNILCNAIDVLESYRASCSSRKRETHPNQITIRTEASPADFITVSIQDNGPGISKKVKERLFDPFFTTKPVGKGTGLGLSISYQIVVDKHQGKLECISSPGKGTEFRITIPVSQPALTTVCEAQQSEATSVIPRTCTVSSSDARFL